MIAKHQKQMAKLVRLTDENNDGIITPEEFKKVRTWLGAMDIEVADAEGLFDLMDDGDGYLTLDEIVSSLARLKGGARSLDVVALKRDVAVIEELLQELTRKVDRLASR